MARSSSDVKRALDALPTGTKSIFAFGSLFSILAINSQGFTYLIPNSLKLIVSLDARSENTVSFVLAIILALFFYRVAVSLWQSFTILFCLPIDRKSKRWMRKLRFLLMQRRGRFSIIISMLFSILIFLELYIGSIYFSFTSRLPSYLLLGVGFHLFLVGILSGSFVELDGVSIVRRYIRSLGIPAAIAISTTYALFISYKLGEIRLDYLMFENSAVLLLKGGESIPLILPGGGGYLALRRNSVSSCFDDGSWIFIPDDQLAEIILDTQRTRMAYCK